MVCRLVDTFFVSLISIILCIILLLAQQAAGANLDCSRVDSGQHASETNIAENGGIPPISLHKVVLSEQEGTYQCGSFQITRSPLSDRHLLVTGRPFISKIRGFITAQDVEFIIKVFQFYRADRPSIVEFRNIRISGAIILDRLHPQSILRFSQVEFRADEMERVCQGIECFKHPVVTISGSHFDHALQFENSFFFGALLIRDSVFDDQVRFDVLDFLGPVVIENSFFRNDLSFASKLDNLKLPFEEPSRNQSYFFAQLILDNVDISGDLRLEGLDFVDAEGIRADGVEENGDSESAGTLSQSNVLFPHTKFPRVLQVSNSRIRDSLEISEVRILCLSSADHDSKSFNYYRLHYLVELAEVPIGNRCAGLSQGPSGFDVAHATSDAADLEIRSKDEEKIVDRRGIIIAETEVANSTSVRNNLISDISLEKNSLGQLYFFQNRIGYLRGYDNDAEFVSIGNNDIAFSLYFSGNNVEKSVEIDENSHGILHGSVGGAYDSDPYFTVSKNIIGGDLRFFPLSTGYLQALDFQKNKVGSSLEIGVPGYFAEASGDQCGISAALHDKSGETNTTPSAFSGNGCFVALASEYGFEGSLHLHLAATEASAVYLRVTEVSVPREHEDYEQSRKDKEEHRDARSDIYEIGGVRAHGGACEGASSWPWCDTLLGADIEKELVGQCPRDGGPNIVFNLQSVRAGVFGWHVPLQCNYQWEGVDFSFTSFDCAVDRSELSRVDYELFNERCYLNTALTWRIAQVWPSPNTDSFLANLLDEYGLIVQAKELSLLANKSYFTRPAQRNFSELSVEKYKIENTVVRAFKEIFRNIYGVILVAANYLVDSLVELRNWILAERETDTKRRVLGTAFEKSASVTADTVEEQYISEDLFHFVMKLLLTPSGYGANPEWSAGLLAVLVLTGYVVYRFYWMRCYRNEKRKCLLQAKDEEQKSNVEQVEDSSRAAVSKSKNIPTLGDAMLGFVTTEGGKAKLKFTLFTYSFDSSVPILDLHCYSKYVPSSRPVRAFTKFQHVLGWWFTSNIVASFLV